MNMSFVIKNRIVTVMSKQEQRETKYLLRQEIKSSGPEESKSSYFKRIYKEFGIVCNNTESGGGDCYGTTFCLCKLSDSELMTYYNRKRKEYRVEHSDYMCCHILICECCYGKCPICGRHGE